MPPEYMYRIESLIWPINQVEFHLSFVRENYFSKGSSWANFVLLGRNCLGGYLTDPFVGSLLHLSILSQLQPVQKPDYWSNGSFAKHALVYVPLEGSIFSSPFSLALIPNLDTYLKNSLYCSMISANVLDITNVDIPSIKDCFIFHLSAYVRTFLLSMFQCILCKNSV